MAVLRREEVRRLRHACHCASKVSRALRSLKTGLGAGPGYRECRKAERLGIPDAVEASVFLAVRPLDPALAIRLGEWFRLARESVAYAAAAIEDRAWDDAAVDLDRAIASLQDIERTLSRELPPPLLGRLPIFR